VAVRLTPYEERLPVLSAPPPAGPGRVRKIGLLGSHEATLKHCPWNDPSWELWGHAGSRGFYKRSPERLFDLHRRECWTLSNHKGERYLKWLATNTVPIFMQERYPEVPASFRYPIERVLAEFRPYFTGHAAWMIALALTEGVTHLGFFGINYGKTTAIGADCEYGAQRGSCEYWMGFAEARGVQLVIPKGGNLLADPEELYGYASHDELGVLVPSYRQRTWLRPDLVKDASHVLLPDGRVVQPESMKKQIEEDDKQRPAWSLGPEPVDVAAADGPGPVDA
jgi:hypothetical protein